MHVRARAVVARAQICRRVQQFGHAGHSGSAPVILLFPLNRNLARQAVARRTIDGRVQEEGLLAPVRRAGRIRRRRQLDLQIGTHGP